MIHTVSLIDLGDILKGHPSLIPSTLLIQVSPLVLSFIAAGGCVWMFGYNLRRRSIIRKITTAIQLACVVVSLLSLLSAVASAAF